MLNEVHIYSISGGGIREHWNLRETLGTRSGCEKLLLLLVVVGMVVSTVAVMMMIVCDDDDDDDGVCCGDKMIPGTPVS